MRIPKGRVILAIDWLRAFPLAPARCHGTMIGIGRRNQASLRDARRRLAFRYRQFSGRSKNLAWLNWVINVGPNAW